MPISLNSLKRNEASFVFEYDGEEAKITYRMSAYTPILEAAVQEKITEGLPATTTAMVLAEMLVAWDVVDENGAQLGVDYETLIMFPIDFLSALLAAISQEQRGAREDRKNSGGGSAQAASSGNARRGTR